MLKSYEYTVWEKWRAFVDTAADGPCGFLKGLY
jgi:hypothetical protein